MALCGVVSALGFVGWIALVTVVSRIEESAGMKPLGWLGGFPDPVVLTCAFMLGPGTACVIAGFSGSLVQRKLLLARVDRCYGRSQCFGCGYSLVGLRRGRERVTCPECGENWPPVGEVSGSV